MLNFYCKSLCFIVFCSLAVPSAMADAVHYSEGANGELQWDHRTPTDIGLLMPGAERHSVSGSVTDIGEQDLFFLANVDPDFLLYQTADIFTFEIGAGSQLDEIKLTEFNAGSNFIMIGLDDGAQFDYSPYDINEQVVDYTAILGATIIGTTDLPANNDSNVLSLLDLAPSGTGVQVPLGPGHYTIYLQETSMSDSEYRLEFAVSSISAVPEPSSLLALAGLGAFVCFQRRRRS